MTLYERTNYLNKDIEYLISKEIVEYDMKEAGFNIVKQFGLLPSGKINELEKLDKETRKVLIGLYQREEKFKNDLRQGFINARKLFFEANNLNSDSILSIKKDAIFTTKICHNNKFEHLNFVPKNLYTSYYLFDRYEFYYNASSLDVKGINDKKLLLHIDGMLSILYDFMYMNEHVDKRRIIKFLKEVIHHYKNRYFDISYYRELNHSSLYRLKDKFNGVELGIEYFDDKSELNIEYNFNTYLLPMIQILM